ncbi:hypothetical protein T02_3045 [Trichinella nativa]|uniref:Uncharacterized protein n=1 Tax=Trichinella nativa TaxID=6335 RepID=A0A0V1LAU5_9BILA|nr:hypothetical protein T02_3045 [Trichinella nativa]
MSTTIVPLTQCGSGGGYSSPFEEENETGNFPSTDTDLSCEILFHRRNSGSQISNIRLMAANSTRC